MDTPRTRSEVIGAISAGSLVVAFCLILLWRDPLLFWNDDYELSVLPVFADVARSWSEGHWPLLSPYSWVCGNLAGEFQYGTFSVFVNAAVILIWKIPLTFPQQAASLSITHLFVLAIGAFLLARDRMRAYDTVSNSLTWRLHRPPLPEGEGGGEGSSSISSTSLSILVALVAALNGWIICWGATDWFGALGAFTWLPWAWWGAERALDRRRTNWRFLWPAPFVYLVVTGGFPYTVVMLALLIVWLSIKSLTQTQSISSVLPLGFGTLLGFGLSAPAWLALLDSVQGSARELQPPSAHWQWIVPPAALPGLILPCWTVKWTDFSTRLIPHTATELACGLVPVPILIAALIGRGRALIKQIRWDLLLLFLVLLLSMLPTAGVFRWSFRWLPFFHLILVICAAEALRTWHGTGSSLGWPGSTTPATTALALVILTAIAMWVLHTGGPYAFPLTWIFLGLAALWALLDFIGRNAAVRRPGHRSAMTLPQDWLPPCVTFAAFLVTYLCIPPNGGVPKYNLSQELLKPSPLDSRRLYLSIYPWAEQTYRVETKPEPIGQIVRPGSTSMWAGLHFINGYSPIRPAGVAREFAATIHGEIDPTTGEYLLYDQAGSEGELAQLGVDGIVVAREMDIVPQPASEWQLVFSADEGRVFHRRGAPFARVRSVTSIDSRPDEQFVPATISRINDSRNRVEVDVDVPDGDRPALLTFSRPYFRGYQARLGNQNLTVTSYRELFPIVEVPAGSHGSLSLTYQPTWLIWGTGAAVACGLVLLPGFMAAIFSAQARRLTPTDFVR